ncbi:MAG: hypothetical protein QY314_03855 [Candidatus Dojkabacteria bacterium]|nr:MAG: hypothetical protein QY314_03855 [Candidatus Dojkabacteria bacterium]
MPVDMREARLVAEFELAAQKLNTAKNLDPNGWMFREYITAKERLDDYRWLKKMHRQIWVLSVYCVAISFVVAILTIILLHKLG